MKWVIENVEWIFSGIGVTILMAIIGIFIKKKSEAKNSQSINSGNDSINIQGGQDVNIRIGGKDDV